MYSDFDSTLINGDVDVDDGAVRPRDRQLRERHITWLCCGES